MVYIVPQHCQILTFSRDHLQLSAGLCFTFASLAQLQKEIPSFLHSEEQAYFNTLSFAKRQHSYLLGRYAAKQALTCYCSELIPTHIAIKTGIFEYPIAYHRSYKKIQITLSHSESLGAALAFPEEYPMGIDIEFIKVHNSSIIEDQLTLTEKQWIQSNNSTIKSEILYTLFWTIKEALSKTLRTGMMCPFEIYAIRNMVDHSHYWTSEFEHFAQYQALSFLLDKFICSIVYPKQTHLIIDIQTIQHWIQHLTFNKFETANAK